MIPELRVSEVRSDVALFVGLLLLGIRRIRGVQVLVAETSQLDGALEGTVVLISHIFKSSYIDGQQLCAD